MTNTLHLRGALARRQHAQDLADRTAAQIAAHGPGLTFGELAIGESFTWPGPRGGPITKVDASHYEFLIHGGRASDGQWPDGTPKRARGTAEAFYRVERP